ncbi:hypothetical protein Cp1R7AA1_224 [Mesorhizobium phage Cp1R7A-A1]|nr:hypothetical protein Cp1R7AA1_224 [Mesorhizobium phage Cp1R7A-A1]
MNSKVRFVPDAAFAIRKATDAALTADTSILIGELKTPLGAVWNAAVKDGNVAIKVKASAMDSTTGDETYAMQVITSATADLAAPTVHQTKALRSGWNELLIDQFNLVDVAPTHKYWGLLIDVGGTTPSVKIEAYVLPDSGKAV